MKTKRFVKKLVLNKKTVSHLDSDELNAVNGGESGPTNCPGCTTIYPMYPTYLAPFTCPDLTRCQPI